jgi:hypothetical protein
MYESVLFGQYNRKEQDKYNTIKSAQRIVEDLNDSGVYWGKNIYWEMKNMNLKIL